MYCRTRVLVEGRWMSLKSWLHEIVGDDLLGRLDKVYCVPLEMKAN